MYSNIGKVRTTWYIYSDTPMSMDWGDLSRFFLVEICSRDSQLSVTTKLNQTAPSSLSPRDAGMTEYT